MSLPVPLYRLQGHGDHFYTTSDEERDAAVSQYGYTYEGIAGYIMPDAVAPDAFTMRDQLAVAVLPAVVQNTMRSGVTHSREQECALAYAYADAMLKARV